MPAPVVFVHDDPKFTEQVANTLKQAGYDVAAFTDPMLALDALDASKTIDLLITRTIFGPGKPNGLALARMARTRRSNIRIIMMAVPAAVEHIEGWGAFVQLPATPSDILTAVNEGFGTQGRQAEEMGLPANATGMSPEYLLLLVSLLVLVVGVLALGWFG